MPSRDPKVYFLCIYACIIFVLLQQIRYRFFLFSTETCIFLVKFLIRCAFRKDKYSHLCYLCCLLVLNHDWNDFYRKHLFEIYENVDYRTRIRRLSRWKCSRFIEVASIRIICSFAWTCLTSVHSFNFNLRYKWEFFEKCSNYNFRLFSMVSYEAKNQKHSSYNRFNCSKIINTLVIPW